jgi:Xaa-Pro dipeptidase
VHSGLPPGAFLDDQTFPYRVHPPFKVWAPLTDAPDCWVFFTPGSRPRLLFLRPEDYWHKAAELPPDSWLDEFDVRIVGSRAAARAHLPADLSRTAYIGEPLPELLAWGVGANNPGHLLAHLHFDRAAKTPYELECLREASRIGARGQRAAECAFHDGASEYQIHLAYLAACGLREQETPYNAIVALNEGGAVLHYQVLQRHAPAESLSLLIDAGGAFRGYASDITRTFTGDRGDFAALVQGMDALQRQLCASVVAGVDWRDIHLQSYRLIAGLLVEADIVRCGVEEAVESALVSVFYPHGIGHLLGLQVHDVGGTQSDACGGEIARPDGHPYLRLTRRLEAGWVVTMEPGLYFIAPLLEQARSNGLGRSINWSCVESLRRFGGVRIEDNLAATATGCENLTRDAFAMLDAAE